MFSNSRPWLLALLLLGLAARAGYSYKFPQWGPGGSIPDPNGYETMAESLLRRGSLENPQGELSAAREPGYPLLLASLYTLTGPSYRAAQALNCALGLLTLLLIFALGRDAFSERVGLLAAAIAAFYPQFIYYSSTLERETFQTFLLTAAIRLLVRARRSPSARRYAAAGAVAALCALTNSVFLPAGLALALGVWLNESAERRKARTAVYLAALLALYAFWPLRNYLQFHRPIIGINGGGAHLYIGLIVPNEAAGTAAERAYVEGDPVARAAVKLGESERDALFFREAAKLILREPVRFAKYALKSLLKLWRLYPYPRAYAHDYRLLFWVSLLSDGWIIPLGFLGILLARRRQVDLDFFYLALGSVSLVYAVFWSIVRYRLPLMPLVILFAAHALLEGWTAARPRLSQR